MKLSRTRFAEDCTQLNISDTLFQIKQRITKDRKDTKLPKLTKSELKKNIWDKYCDTTTYITYKGNTTSVPINLGFTSTQFNGVRFHYICPNCNTSARKLYSPDFETRPFLCRNCYNLKYYLQHFGKSRQNIGMARYRAFRKKYEAFNYSQSITGKRRSSKRDLKLTYLIQNTSIYQNRFISQLRNFG